MQRLMGVRYRDWNESNNLFSAHTGTVAEQFVSQELICLERQCAKSIVIVIQKSDCHPEKGN